jgi:hypothetical protein
MLRAIAALLVSAMLAVVLTPAAASAAAGPCSVNGGHLDWGLKKAFRDYITGPVAAGSWMVGDSASYQAGRFRWPSASGTLTPSSGTGLVGFIGSVTFTGHAGAVHRTFANPELQFVNPTLAYLLVDVTGVTSDGTSVDSPGVQFARLDLPAGVLDTRTSALTVDAVPATLTDTGAGLLGGYASGEALDSVSFVLRFSSACSSSSSSSSSVAPSATPDAVSSPIPVGLLPWLVLALGLVAILVLVGLVLTRRRSE